MLINSGSYKNYRNGAVHWPKNLEIWPGTTCSLAWPVAGCTRTTLGWRKNQFMESKHQLRPGPADLHLLVGSWRLGGIAYVYVWMGGFLTPQKATLNSMRTLLWFVSYRRLSPQFQFFFVCMCSALCICHSLIMSKIYLEKYKYDSLWYSLFHTDQ